jgi:hypothetical protein
MTTTINYFGSSGFVVADFSDAAVSAPVLSAFPALINKRRNISRSHACQLS